MTHYTLSIELKGGNYATAKPQGYVPGFRLHRPEGGSYHTLRLSGGTVTVALKASGFATANWVAAGSVLLSQFVDALKAELPRLQRGLVDWAAACTHDPSDSNAANVIDVAKELRAALSFLWALERELLEQTAKAELRAAARARKPAPPAITT